MRPGEYCNAGHQKDSNPFRLCDIFFRTYQTKHHTFDTPISTLANSTQVALNFSNQKKGVKGESIGHGTTGHLTSYPCAVWPTGSPISDAEGRPVTRHSVATTMVINGDQSRVRPSQRLSATASPSSVQQSGSSQPISLSGRFEPVARWPYSLTVSKPTPSASSSYGGETSCFVTSMLKRAQ